MTHPNSIAEAGKSDWLPISTAPIKPFDPDKWFMNHSERLLLAHNGNVSIGAYRFTSKGKGKWEAGGRIVLPTHWMDLPLPPKQEQPA